MGSTVIQDGFVSLGHKCTPSHPPPLSYTPPLSYLSHAHTHLRNLPEGDCLPFFRYLQQEGSTLVPSSTSPHGTPAVPHRHSFTRVDHPNIDATPVSLPRLPLSRLRSPRQGGVRHTPVSWSQNILQQTALVKGHFHYGYGGNVRPECVVIPQFYDITTLRRSHVRINDELVPKPTEIKIGKKQIRVPVPREHPYQSHISRYAMFPTFRSPDDPDTGVRAGTRRPLNPLIPACAHDITVLTKTKGAPFRHEVLNVPMVTQRKALQWPGQHGFYQFPKTVSSERQVFYPLLPKTTCPNATLRGWDSTLCERTSNMLRNLERTHWLTSYQLNYTGSGPANPLLLDDLHEKTIETTVGEHTPYRIQLRERSYSIPVPPRPPAGRKARIQQDRRTLRSSYSNTQYQPSYDPGNEPSNRPDNDPENQHANHDRLHLCSDHYHRSSNHDNSGCGYHTDKYSRECEREKFQIIPDQSSIGEIEEREEVMGHCDTLHRHVQFCCETCGAKEGYCGCQSQRSNLIDLDHPSHTPIRHTLIPRTQSLNLGKMTQPGSLGGMDVLESLTGECPRVPMSDVGVPRSFSCIHPRVNALEEFEEGYHQGGSGCERGSGGGLFRSQSVLLDLQDSFSRYNAHKQFHHTLRGAPSDLRDNHHTGRRHSFYGFNSFHFHN